MTLLSPDIEESIQRYIRHVRLMNTLTDEQLTLALREKALMDPDSFEALKEGATKKMLKDVKKMTKDIKSDSKFVVRRVDDLT